MKLTVLGNNGPYPSPFGACSGYLLEHEGTSLLLDCGPGVLSRLESVTDISKLSGMILSHLHFDHVSDLFALQYHLQFDPPAEPIKVYAPQSPKGILSLITSPHLSVYPIGQLNEIGTVRFSVLRVRHPVETYAVRAVAGSSTFVYTGDTNMLDGLKEFCQDADCLLADAGLSNIDHSEQSPHLSAYLCGKLGKDAAVGQLVLTHFNPRYSVQALLEEARTNFPSAIAAQLQQEIII